MTSATTTPQIDWKNVVIAFLSDRDGVKKIADYPNQESIELFTSRLRKEINVLPNKDFVKAVKPIEIEFLVNRLQEAGYGDLALGVIEKLTMLKTERFAKAIQNSDVSELLRALPNEEDSPVRKLLLDKTLELPSDLLATALSETRIASLLSIAIANDRTWQAAVFLERLCLLDIDDFREATSASANPDLSILAEDLDRNDLSELLDNMQSENPLDFTLRQQAIRAASITPDKGTVEIAEMFSR